MKLGDLFWRSSLRKRAAREIEIPRMQVFEVEDLVIPAGTTELVLFQFDAEPFANFVASFELELAAPLPVGPTLRMRVSPSANHNSVLGTTLDLVQGSYWSTLPLVDGFGYEFGDPTVPPAPIPTDIWLLSELPTVAEMTVRARAAFLVP